MASSISNCLATSSQNLSGSLLEARRFGGPVLQQSLLLYDGRSRVFLDRGLPPGLVFRYLVAVPMMKITPYQNRSIYINDLASAAELNSSLRKPATS